MSAIWKQIVAAKYAKRIVKALEKVPADIRQDVITLIIAELESQPQAAVAVTAETVNPLAS